MIPSGSAPSGRLPASGWHTIGSHGIKPWQSSTAACPSCEQRNCHCLTQITPISRIEPVALTAGVSARTICQLWFFWLIADFRENRPLERPSGIVVRGRKRLTVEHAENRRGLHVEGWCAGLTAEQTAKDAKDAKAAKDYCSVSDVIPSGNEGSSRTSRSLARPRGSYRRSLAAARDDIYPCDADRGCPWRPSRPWRPWRSALPRFAR